jgi:hypothetical protein
MGREKARWSTFLLFLAMPWQIVWAQDLEINKADNSEDALAPCCECSPPDIFWFGGDYLFWKVRGAPLPTLIGSIPREQADLIHSFPDSTITPLIGGAASGINYRAQSGMLFNAGLWATPYLGLEANYWQLEQAHESFCADSKGYAALGPVFTHDQNNGSQTIIMTGIPGLREGMAAVDIRQQLWGTEINAFRRWQLGGIFDYLDVLGGFRHLQFSEGIRIAGTSSVIPGGQIPCG